MLQQHCLAITSHEQVAQGVFRLRLAGNLSALPGQFVQVAVSCNASLSASGTLPPSCDPLLRRPLSVQDCRPGELALLYRVAGRGTAQLAGRKPGGSVDVLGPLGRGFPLPAGRQAILVAGGIGAAPLFYLARTLHAEGKDVFFLFGARDQEGLYLAGELASVTAKLQLATEDGSAGYHGLVTDLLPPEQSYPAAPVFACGPTAMLRTVATLCREARRECFVSLESRMACGVGACLGCVVETSRGGQREYARVCVEGPVFRGEEVFGACRLT